MDMSPNAHLQWTTHESPLGVLTAVASAEGSLRNVFFAGQAPALDPAARRPLESVTAQLDQYFAGERQGFELALDLSGAPLRMAVWQRLREIPYGATVSYGELAGDLDPAVFPAGIEPYECVRAVGTAIGRTPTPIVIPCHRVIGADGSLTGYGGGLERKRVLLDLERRVAAGLSPELAWAQRQLAIL
jgi:methylated-DNA-[protein]-cysteine S-methyltransferase